jgi:hypothetical protein
MSSDNSHIRSAGVGSFSGRVGHKAGGFISKKFFHPSNMKNQEKLWQAIEAKKAQEKRQDDLQKKREDEKRSETLQDEMRGSVSSSMIPATLTASLGRQGTDGKRQKINPDELETRKRLDLLRSASHTPKSSVRLSIRSRYGEDVLDNGHSSVWGSHFDLETKCWGYKCCKQTDKSAACSN